MMKLIKYKVFIAVFIIYPAFTWSQDTINMLDGRQIIAKSIYNEPAGSLLKYDIVKRKGKVKQKAVYKTDVFSINFANNERQIFYKQDSVSGIEYSVDQMNTYINGEREAIKCYNATWVNVGGFAFGTVSTYFFGFWGLLSAPVYGVGMGLITPKVKTSENINQTLKNDKYFLGGYKSCAANKKMKNAILGSVGGFAIIVIAKNVF